MKILNAIYNYTARRCSRYPNAAEPEYFIGKFLDIITATVTCMGTVTLLLYFLTF